jgi:ABC-type hemin transport system ATPase subunit
MPADVLRADAIRRVYGIDVQVMAHPQTGRPIVVPDIGHRIGALAAGAAS